jgi:hypothetical protein
MQQKKFNFKILNIDFLITISDNPQFTLTSNNN